MIYFDNAATTPMDPEVIGVIEESFRKDFGNSGTVYSLGLDAKKKIEDAETSIRESLNIPARFKIVFTSGGSASNNLFIKGLCFPDKLAANLGLEHPSVSKTLEYFNEMGNASISLLKYQKNGTLDLKGISELKDKKVKLLCLSHVNNELGSINDPLHVAPILKGVSSKTRLFLDGVQAVGKIKLDKELWGNVSGYSISAHKIHGPKGIGLLIFDGNLSLNPLIHGGNQQFGLLSGTLPVPLIIGVAETIKIAIKHQEETKEHLEKLSNYLIKRLNDLNDKMPHLNLKFNSSPNPNDPFQSPGIVNFSFFPVEGEIILHHLEKENIFVGLGSACSAHSKEPSKILIGIGLSPQEARCSLRISFNRNNTIQEIDKFIVQFAKFYDELFSLFKQHASHS